MIVVTHQQAAEVAQPREGAFDHSAFAVAVQRAVITERRLAANIAMRTNQQRVDDQHLACVAETAAQALESIGAGSRASNPPVYL